MTRLGRDSTTSTDIPIQGTEVAIGYANGRYAWTPEDWARFPHVPHLTIDVNGGDPSADALDIETYDAKVSQAPGWTRQHNAARRDYPAILYCDRATLTPLFNLMNANHLIVGRDFRLFIATLDGTRTVADMTGVWGIQYAGEAQTGGHYDETIVYDNAWKAPTPVPTPPPPPPVRHNPPAPPGLWLDGTFTGRGMDTRLWRTDYDSATGQWSAPIREA